jgi:sulfatase modifying factor 1
VVLVLSALAPACGVGLGEDDAVDPDAGPDAAGDDAIPGDDGGGMDATAMGMDGARMDAGTPCSVMGTPGVCIPVSECGGGRVATPGFCPGPAAIQCCTPRPPDGGAGDGGWTCDPMAMPQPNAGLVEDPGVGGCPAGMVPVAGFCVDRYEASLALVDVRGGLTPWSPYWNPGTQRVRALSIRGAVPQGYITGEEAQAACREAGKRLCTDTEWLRACRGPSGTIYPYGNTRMSGVCNDARARHPAVEYFGTDAPWVYSMIGHPCLNQLPDSLDRTGSNPGCATVDGVMDMMGNLHEWTADPAGTFRGGFYVDTRINGEGCLYATTAHDTRHWDYSTGFRCCADL